MGDLKTNLNVQHEEMAKGAQSVEEHSNKIMGISKTLHGQVEGLMGKWKGDAATAFNGAYMKFNDAFVDVQKQLEIIHSKLAEAQKSYGTTENENAAATNAVSNMINR